MSAAGLRLQQPNVHALADDLLDHVMHDTPTHPNPKEGGGSANMEWMLLVQRYFKDPSVEHVLLDALDLHERVGFLSWGPAGGRVEQGIASPHIELHLNWSGLLLLDSVRRGRGAVTSRMVRFFGHLYSLSLPCMTPKGQVLGPGARMSDFGPADKTLDGAVAAVGGKVTDFKQVFHNLDRSTCGVWAILEALKLDPHLFDEARGWTLDGIEQHWPVLRWELIVQRFANGHKAVLSGSAVADDPAMGKVGSGGVGVHAVFVTYAPLAIQWVDVGGVIHGNPISSDLGQPLGRAIGRGGPAA